MSPPKPLVAYYIACPSCGFREMHMHDKAGFVETTDGQNLERPATLIATTNPLGCMYCGRTIIIANARIRAAHDQALPM